MNENEIIADALKSSIYDRATRIVKRGLIFPVKYNPDIRDEIWYSVFNIEHNILRNAKTHPNDYSSRFVNYQLENYENIVNQESDIRTYNEKIADFHALEFNRNLIKLEVLLAKNKNEEDMELVVRECEMSLKRYEKYNTRIEESKSKERIQARTQLLKEEIVMKAWHPSRVERWIDAGIELEDM